MDAWTDWAIILLLAFVVLAGYLAARAYIAWAQKRKQEINVFLLIVGLLGAGIMIILTLSGSVTWISRWDEPYFQARYLLGFLGLICGLIYLAFAFRNYILKNKKPSSK